MLRILRPCLCENIDRLTSPNFVASLSIEKLRREIDDAVVGGKKRECELLAKYCLNVENAWKMIGPLNRAAEVHDSFAQVANKIVSSTLNEITSTSDVSVLQHIVSDGSTENFVSALKRLNQVLADLHTRNFSTPSTFLRVIPVVESEIVRRRKDFQMKEIRVVIDSIARLKIANVSVFEAVIEAILLFSSSSKIDLLKPSSALMFLRELGWAGYTHSVLKELVTPVLSRSSFRNFQAVSSVMIIAGGLTPGIVESCMQTFRSDKGTKHALDADSASQLIRRLVVCGFYVEAMEVFESFPIKSFLNLNKRNSISQIHRLFAASFIAPDIVSPRKVSGLRGLSANIELTSVSAHQVGGSSFIHNLVVNALNRLQVEHVSEYVDEECLLVIDIFVPSLKLAIEVQGPSHYITDLADGSRKLRPEDEFKLAVLSKRGYKIEQLSVFDFGRNHATRNADDRIREIIAFHGSSSYST